MSDFADEETFVREYRARFGGSIRRARMKYRFGANIFDLIRKYTSGPKRVELGAQVSAIVEGIVDGYGLGGVAGWTDFAWKNGHKDERLMDVRLSDLILWHPVRGEGIERAEAGPKTTARSRAMADALRAGTVTYSREAPLTYAQLDAIPLMKSDDPVLICPVNSIRKEVEESEPVQTLIREIAIVLDGIKVIENRLEEDDTLSDDPFLSSNLILMTPEQRQEAKTTLRLAEQKRNELFAQLQDLLYQDYKQYFLILSGQGRIQAIIEAVKDANIPPDTFWIRLTCKSIYVDLCNTLLQIHNRDVRLGRFSDPRHEVWVDGRYVPMTEVPLAFSCAKFRFKNDTTCYARYMAEDPERRHHLKCADIYKYPITIDRLGTF